ncbi:MAG: methyltransferase domain-containing protein, partial [Gammaproteobacteria bacterium]|nr:methyltransferase domain-containing protein [Gammaproteobacteria bacterium]
MIPRTDITDIRALTSHAVEGMSEHDRDEMAIPSYLHGNPLIRWLMWRRYEAIAEMLTGGADRKALEFGCGVGLFLPELCAKFSSVYAVDLFPQYARQLASQRGLPVTFPEHVDEVADGSLDAIVAADVLEHLEDLEQTLELFRRKLKRGGELLVSGPTESFFYQVGRILAGFGDKGDYHHTNIDKLIEDIRGSGFTVQR